MTIREMLNLMPHGEWFSEWIMVNDPTGKVFYGRRDDIPEMVADMPVGKIEATYVWEPNMYVISVNTWKRMGTYED